METQYPWLLFSLLALPVVIALWLWMTRWKRKALEQYGDLPLILQQVPDHSQRRFVLKFLLLALAFAMILIGMTNPRILYHKETVKKTEADIMFCIDISNSMMARDIKPDRLERTRMAISRLIDRFEKDQVGIIVFAGRSQVLYPLSPDYAGAKMFLETLSPEIISVQGTAIGSALDLATASFSSKSRAKKIIILISDGENHEDDAMAAATKAVEKGITIFTVGIGSPEGAPIPVSNASGSMEYKKDENGNTVITRLNEGMLRQIAAIGKGTYTRASNEDTGLEKIYKTIQLMDKGESEAIDFSDYENLYPYFLGMGLLLLLLEFFIFERQTRLTRNLHLFSTPGYNYVIRSKKQ